MRRAALFLALAAAGCAGAPPAIGEPGAELPDPKAEAQYQAALRKVTQHREVYSGIDTQLFTAATYQSADFREARVRRQAAFQTWPEPKLERRQWLIAADGSDARRRCPGPERSPSLPGRRPIPPACYRLSRRS